MSELAFSSAVKFADYVVVPNIEEFMQAPSDLKAAYNAVMAIDSIVGFLFLEKQHDTKNDSLFREQLALQDESYSLIRDLAKTYKHIKLTRPAGLTTIDQTLVSGRPYGSGLYGVGTYGGEEVMIIDNQGQTHHAVSRVVKAWAFLSSQL